MSLDFMLYVPVDTGGKEPADFILLSENITHNVTPMWKRAGCYEALYKSDGKKAGEIIPALENAVLDMQNNPRVYEALNPPNGWGTFEGAFRFLQKVLDACQEHPKAIIDVDA